MAVVDKVFDEMPMIKDIKLEGAVRDYYNAFMSYYKTFICWTRELGLNEGCLIILFMERLQPEIEKIVYFQPKTLHDAYLLANLQETTIEIMKKKANTRLSSSRFDNLKEVELYAKPNKSKMEMSAPSSLSLGCSDGSNVNERRQDVADDKKNWMKVGGETKSATTVKPLAFVSPDKEEEAILGDISKGEVNHCDVSYNSSVKVTLLDNITDAEEFAPTTEKDSTRILVPKTNLSGQDSSWNAEQIFPEMISGIESYQGITTSSERGIMGSNNDYASNLKLINLAYVKNQLFDDFHPPLDKISSIQALNKSEVLEMECKVGEVNKACPWWLDKQKGNDIEDEECMESNNENRVFDITIGLKTLSDFDALVDSGSKRSGHEKDADYYIVYDEEHRVIKGIGTEKGEKWPKIVPILIYLEEMNGIEKLQAKNNYGVTGPQELCRTNMGAIDINTLTIEQYLALTRRDIPGVVVPELGYDVDFEIKSQFMSELRCNLFAGINDENAYEHVRRVLEIIDLFHIPGVTHDAVMLKVIPITLTRAFIKKYCPPLKTTKKLEEIRNFKQGVDETLYQAWERYNDLLFKCP
ncbi:hypothetical protein Tco_0133720 [Tanacetum coccineum]